MAQRPIRWKCACKLSSCPSFHSNFACVFNTYIYGTHFGPFWFTNEVHFFVLRTCLEYDRKTDWFCHLFLLLFHSLWNFVSAKLLTTETSRKGNFTDLCSWQSYSRGINPGIQAQHFFTGEPGHISSPVELGPEPASGGSLCGANAGDFSLCILVSI